MSKYFMKNNEKKCKETGVTPDYEKMQADSSPHQQQQQMFQKVLLGHRSGRLSIARYTANFRSKYSLITKL